MKDAASATHVFTYGSLMFAPVWERVCRRSYSNQLARLAGHSRFALMGESYPAVVKAEHGTVSGRLYFNVDAQDVVRLDAFEGKEYQRVSNTVVLADGSTCLADHYLYQGPIPLADKDWDPAWFEREGIVKFMQTYCEQRGV